MGGSWEVSSTGLVSMYNIQDSKKQSYSDSISSAMMMSLPVMQELNNEAESGRITKAALYSDQFSEVFRRLLQKGKISCYQVSQFTGIDQAYLSRLKNGEKQKPSTEIMIKISLALVHTSLEIKIYDIESLFNSTGRTISPRH